MVTDEGLSKSGSLSYNGNHGEIVAPKKKVVEEPRRALRRLVETMTLGVPAVMVALLPFIMTYVPAPESVLRLKDFVAEWCTPSLCFVFLIVGVMVATSGVLNGTHAGGMHDRADVYQRHVTVVQRDSLRMPDIFSAGESVRPLSIPAPVPVPFAVPVPVRDFPPASPRALPIYLKREALPGHDHELRSPLGKSRSSPLPVVKENIPSAKLPSYQSLTQEASYLSTAREPVVVDTLQERPTARKPSPAAAPVPVFEHEVPMVSAPVVVPSPAYTPVIEEVPTAPVLDREIPAVAPPSPIPSPVFVHEDITVPDTVPTPTPIDDPVSDREMSPDPTPPPPPPPAAPVFDSEIPTAPMPAEVKVSASVARSVSEEEKALGGGLHLTPAPKGLEI